MGQKVKKQVKYADAEACVHCHLCRNHCAFLGKYGIDIGDTERLKELAYHCFLCGRCTEVCPKGIDGRQVILNMRQKAVRENGGRVPEKGYGMLLWEKRDYRFRNEKNIRGKSILFPGCNFPSFFPETTRYLAENLAREAGMGILFDCCGKPVAELGMEDEERRIITRLDQRLKEKGIEEVVTMCPNCYHFLKGRLSIEVKTVYRKLRELGLGKKIAEKAVIFPPCPDREEKEMLRDICYFLSGEPDVLEGVQCCGLGGCAGVKEPELAGKMPQGLEDSKSFFTYCASCSGSLTRKGYRNASHILPEILGRTERPDVKKSVLNRIKAGCWKEKSYEKRKNMG